MFTAGAEGTPSITTTGDTNTGIFFPTADTIAFTEGGTEAMRIDSSANLKFNSGYGSVETAFGCRAWVNFNGSGTVAIRGSGNVTSITDNGTGDYTVNFTTAMPDVNYSVNVNAQGNGDATRGGGGMVHLPRSATAPTTSAIRFVCHAGSSSTANGVTENSSHTFVSVFR